MSWTEWCALLGMWMGLFHLWRIANAMEDANNSLRRAAAIYENARDAVLAARKGGG